MLCFYFTLLVLTGGIAAVVSSAVFGGAATASAVGGAAVGGFGLSFLGGSLYGLNKSSERGKVLKTECNNLKSQLECIKLEYEGQMINLDDKLTKHVNLVQDNKF